MFPLWQPLMNRRQMLCRLGNGFGALGLASVLADEAVLGSPARAAMSGASNPLAPKAPHFTPRARRVIFLFMNGGPSQVDTFDPKPTLAKYAGQMKEGTGKGKGEGKLLPSPFTFAKYGQSGIEVSELFPLVARHVDELCIIRSMHTNIPNHEPSLLMMNSGESQPTRPSLGSWLTYGLGTENQNLPGYVVLCPGKPVVGPQLWSNSFLPGIYQGTHINNSRVDPKNVIQHLANRYLPRDDQRRQFDLLQQMNEAHSQEHGRDDQLEARIASLEMAFRMQIEGQEAFDLTRETTATRNRYGDGPFANACLIARRLVERGVRMTQVYYGDDQPWDDHNDILNHRNHAQRSDRPIAALLTDLKARGLLDETLVVWGGEFGRTPASQDTRGRDHNSKGFSMWLAGGGVKGGYVHGATDEFGSTAVQKKVHVHDLHATILHLLGIDHERLTFRYSGRDFRLTDVHGELVRDILA
jgi:Protein of unknown function (DUF1501)